MLAQYSFPRFLKWLLAPVASLIAVTSPYLTARADVTAREGLAVKVAPAFKPKVQPFDLAEVTLLDGPFKTAQQRGAKWLLSLEPDRFLSNFRKEAGLKPKAEHYPGWERQGVSGHSGGHYLSACALAYASTGNKAFLNRVNYMVDELALCQQAQKDGYLAAIPNGRKVFEEVKAGQIRSAGFDLNGCWVPLYTLHKLMAGLRDAYRICGNTKALAVELQFADWLHETFAHLNESQMQKVLACEHGGINETLADLYADSGDPRYLQLSRKFHHKAILDPLANGQDILPGKHANTQIPKITGLATRYELAGDPSDRAAAAFFWDQVVHHHSYITGGHCDHEHFGQPDKLNDRLSENTTETCNVYNMLRLTKHLFGWEADPDAADFYERALFNHMLATQHPDGRVIYNLSLKPGHHKVYQKHFDWFTCCMGTGMENHVKYGEAIYFHDQSSLYVNLYIASELRWPSKHLILRQETAFPDKETASFQFKCKEPMPLTLRLRHPYWAKQGLKIKINGAPVDNHSTPSSYAALKRTWNPGDRVEVVLPMTLRTESMPDNPRRLGIFYGPTLLAGDLGPVNDPKANGSFYVPVLVTDHRPVTDWVKPVADKSLTFRTDRVGKPRDVSLSPFFRLHDRRLTVFFDLYSQTDWQAREQAIRAEQERLRELEARTVDVLRIGEMQPERDHNLKGERTSAGEAFGRKWRHATDGGWFSFDMKVQPGKTQALLVTYWGNDGGNRNFDILVDGQKIASQQLQNNRPGKFFDETYPVSSTLTKDKTTVEVKFQAHPDAWAGGVFGVRMMRNE